MLMLVGRVGRSSAAADRHMAGQCTALTSFQCLQTHVQGRRPACGQATAFGAADALVKVIQKAKRALLQRQQAIFETVAKLHFRVLHWPAEALSGLAAYLTIISPC